MWREERAGDEGRFRRRGKARQDGGRADGGGRKNAMKLHRFPLARAGEV